MPDPLTLLEMIKLHDYLVYGRTQYGRNPYSDIQKQLKKLIEDRLREYGDVEL